jgi:hypothetical protein
MLQCEERGCKNVTCSFRSCKLDRHTVGLQLRLQLHADLLPITIPSRVIRCGTIVLPLSATGTWSASQGEAFSSLLDVIESQDFSASLN